MHTNRKGVLYYLGRAVTRTGKGRYVFNRERPAEPVEVLPPGYRISESVNGVVSLVKDAPSIFRPEEVATVKAAVGRHPHPSRYRVVARSDRIEVYERSGMDIDEAAEILGMNGRLTASRLAMTQARLDRTARYDPVLRFSLLDAGRRTFSVQRRCYLLSLPDWLNLMSIGDIETLAAKVIPALGSEEFFELW
jgi:hypothetical protein